MTRSDKRLQGVTNTTTTTTNAVLKYMMSAKKLPYNATPVNEALVEH